MAGRVSYVANLIFVMVLLIAIAGWADWQSGEVNADD